MKISIELFLLDNFIMNYLIFVLAAVLSGTRMKMGYAALSALVGAVYALLSLAGLSFLRWLPIKLIAFGLMALPLRAKGQKYHYLLLSVFLAAFLLSGTLLFLTGLFGGSVQSDGAVAGTVPIRVALLGAGLGATLPRLFRKLFAAHHLRAHTERLAILLGGQTRACTALIDSGNTLIEPLSGLPVILVSWALPVGGRSIPYQAQGGAGVLQGLRPARILFAGMYEVDAFICTAPQPIVGAQAIFPSQLVPNEWRGYHENDPKPIRKTTAVAVQTARQKLLVHPFQRNPARPAQRGGGSALCRATRCQRANSVIEIGGNAFLETPWFENLQNDAFVVVGGNVLIAYRGTDANVVIPENVQHIGDDVFGGNEDLISVTIPGNVINIGRTAFLGCSNMTSVIIADGVTSIGAEAFYFCEKLESMLIHH